MSRLISSRPIPPQQGQLYALPANREEQLSQLSRSQWKARGNNNGDDKKAAAAVEAAATAAARPLPLGKQAYWFERCVESGRVDPRWNGGWRR